MVSKKIRLNGKESATILVKLIDDAGNPPDKDVNITIRGFLKFNGSSSVEDEQTTASQIEAVNRLENRTIVFPVLFTRRNITVKNGISTITLLPRSEDILEDTQTIIERSEELGVEEEINEEEIVEEDTKDVTKIFIEEGVERRPYDIEVQVTIDDDFYFGETVSPKVKLDEKDKTSRFVADVYQQGENITIPYFSDIDWIPSINKILDSNNSTAEDVLKIIRSLSNSVPFGASAVFDAVVAASDILADTEFNDIRKLVYLFTDNESNLSISSLDDAIEEVNGIDGNKEVPVLIGNMSVLQPITLSAKANTTDVKDLIELSALTGGQSVTVLSEDFVDDIANLFSGEAVGALGYGVFNFTIDLEENVDLNSIMTFFDLPEDTGASWSISVSQDGFVFEDINDSYKPDTEVIFKDLNIRYIKFNVILITGFISSEDPYESKVSSPSLTEIKIKFNKSKTSYLFLNLETTPSSPQNVALSVNSNNGDNIEYDQIKIGAATSDSHNFIDYNTPSHPSVDQNGKTIIPIRFSENVSDFPQEELTKIDNFTYKSVYGRWDPQATVIVFDQNGNVINSNDYKTFPRKGMIVFNSLREERKLTIGVLNQKVLKVGLELISKSETNSLEILGLGYMYNTNVDLLPPIEKQPPEARNLVISPNNPTIYSVISADYTYFDVNFDEEDLENIVLEWYINDVNIPYLNGLKKWNDLNNIEDPIYSKVFSFDPNEVDDVEREARRRAESILKVGDRVYFKLRVSDGELLSDVKTSDTIIVQEGTPSISDFKIWAVTNEGVQTDPLSDVSTDRLSSDKNAVVKYNLISDSDTNVSEIIWYVVDANANTLEFKRGIAGEVDPDTKVPSEVIIPGETNEDNVLALTIGREIFAQIKPRTDSKEGDTITSESVIVKNALPEVSDVKIGNVNPVSNEDLILTWQFFDFEITALGDLTQSDETRVEWFKFDIDANEFVRFENIGRINTTVETSSSILQANGLTKQGEKWKAIVIPSDGLDEGVPVESNIVTIA